TGTTAGIPASYTQAKGAFAVQSYGLTATQTLYNGFQTATRTRQAEGQVFSARETLRTFGSVFKDARRCGLCSSLRRVILGRGYAGATGRRGLGGLATAAFAGGLGACLGG